jgi:hypothetical protein
MIKNIPCMEQIKQAASEIVGQMLDLAGNLSDEEFTRSLPVLLDNSIGRHYRHVIEFFQVLIAGTGTGEINYDKRKHDAVLEQSPDQCRERLREIRKAISRTPMKDLTLCGSYEREPHTSFSLSSNSERELVYQVEHAIHHLAMIRIALQHGFPHLQVSREFGYAHSTLKHIDR